MMKYIFSSLAFGLASAGVLHSRTDKCCFMIDVSGGAMGSLGQLSDGQNRIGPNQSGASYCIDNGSITDASGRGCILTPPTTQFQCDVGATPTPGFSIDMSGEILYKGSDSFYACPTDQNGDYNIYTVPVSGQTKCIPVKLSSKNGACVPKAAQTSPMYQNSTIIKTVVPPTSVVSVVGPTQVNTAYQTETDTVIQTQYFTKSDTVYLSAPAPTPMTITQTITVQETVTQASACPAASTVYMSAVCPSAAAPVSPVSQISDHQPQAPAMAPASMAAPPAPAAPVSQISDHQPQAPTIAPGSVAAPAPTAPVSQISDHQPQAPISAPASSSFIVSPLMPAPAPPVTSSIVVSPVMPAPAPPITSSKPSMASAPYQNITSLATSTVAPKPSGTCPLNLPANYQYPHLIVPIDKDQPTTALGTSYNGKISSSVSSIFNFDVPQSYAGKTCSLVFSLPTQSQLETSSFTTSGSGSVDVKVLSSVANAATTYSNVPSVASDLGSYTLVPGNSYTIRTVSCPAGKTLSYELSASGDYALDFFQDYNPCPIGLYVITS